MAKPPSSVRSIRLADEAWDWLAGEAARRGTNVNALVAGLVDLARNPPRPEELRRTAALAKGSLPADPGPPTATVVAAVSSAVPALEPAPMIWPSGALLEPRHKADPGLEGGTIVRKLDVPLAGTFERKPLQKTPKGKR